MDLHDLHTQNVVFICNRIKKGENRGEKKFHTKTMMSRKANEALK